MMAKKKRKLSDEQKKKIKKVAEKLKKKRSVGEPFALATAIAKGTVRRKKKGKKE